MSLPPEVRELLGWDAELGQRLDGLGLDRRREVIRDALADRALRTALPKAPVARTDELSVPVSGAEIRLRLYTPHGTGPHPVFFHVHGGGFVVGSIDDAYTDAKCAHICAGAGCAVTTVEYRLAPEHPYPTAPEDCYAALLWLVDHAGTLNLDPGRLALGGESAGGNLAAVLALMVRDRNGPSPALQLLEVPVTDMSERSGRHRSLIDFGDGYGLDRSAIEEFQDAYLPDRARRDEAYASPLCAADLTAVAPAYVVTAEYDPLRDSGEAYARRLQEAGVRTTLHRFANQTHGSSSLWHTWPDAGSWMEEIVTAVRDALSANLASSHRALS